jgi:filamentous hemagglutinin family protein
MEESAMPSLSRSLLLVFCALVSLWLAAVPLPARGAVTLDGTLGPAGSLRGPDYDIRADLGRQLGGNLFHSFGEFNLLAGESATFSGPDSVENIIARVTGGHESVIDGLLRSTIPGANLFFLNPAGVMFGPQASLDLQGSFHLSTADYLGLGAHGRFGALHPEASELTADPPAAFGFLSDNPAGISLNSSGSLEAANGLTVRGGQTISVVGGAIEIGASALPSADGSLMATRIMAPGGRINLVSVASPGELPLDTMETSGFSRLGDVTMVGHAWQGAPSQLDASSPGGGEIFIRAGQFVLDGSRLLANTLGTGDGQGIDIGVQGLELNGGSSISAHTVGPGRGGPINIRAAETVSIVDDGGIYASVFASGDGGSIAIQTSELALGDSAAISAIVDPGASGKGGGIAICAADTVSIAGGSGIYASTKGSGAGGSILIDTAALSLADYGSIEAKVIGEQGRGNGGSITLRAKDLSIADTAYITTAVEAEAGGKGGDISIQNADTVTIAGMGGIYATTQGAGDGGSIRLDSATLSLADYGTIEARAGGSGNGGSITIHAQDLAIVDSALISASLDDGTSGHGGDVAIDGADTVTISGEGGIYASAFGSGYGGSIRVDAAALSLTDYGSIETSVGGSGTGKGGSIAIRTKELTLSDTAYLSASVEDGAAGHGGDITIQGADTVGISGEGGIYASTYGSGDGGSIRLDTAALSLVDDASIEASAGEESSGNGGSITVQTGALTLADTAYMIASVDSGATGHGGDIAIRAADRVDISGEAMINASTFGSGNGGSILVDTAAMTLVDSASIRANAAETASGNGGSITVQSTDLNVADSAYIAASVNPEASGHGGDITLLAADRISLTGNGGIYASTFGKGDGGSILMESTALSLAGHGSIEARAGGTGSGHGGSIMVRTKDLTLADTAYISASVDPEASGNGGDITIHGAGAVGISGKAGVYASTYGTGDGGSLLLVAKTLSLSDYGALEVGTTDQSSGQGGNLGLSVSRLVMNGGTLSADSAGSGRAGDVTIWAADGLELRNATIATSALAADGGNIGVQAGRMLHLDHSAITTSVQGGDGNGGNITIDPRFVILDHSRVIANAWGGHGGNIGITAGTFIQDPPSVITASSKLGIDGVITVDSPTNDVAGALAILPESFLGEVNLASNACAARTMADSSSLVLEGASEVLPGEGPVPTRDSQAATPTDRKK